MSIISPNNPALVRTMLLDWAFITQQEANEHLGSPEGAAKLAESKRYMLAATTIERLLSRGQ